MDPEELKLYTIMIDAEYDYYNYLRTKLFPKFLKETEGYVMDTTSTWYKFFNVLDEKLDSKQEIELKDYYKSLALICHPDKCDSPWSKNIFQKVVDAYSTRDLNTLERLNDHWIKHGTFENFTETVKKTKIELIDLWKREAWYQWYQPNSLIKAVLIPEAEYINRLHKTIETLKDKCQNLEQKLTPNAHK